jgi:hypothetical protein
VDWCRRQPVGTDSAQGFGAEPLAIIPDEGLDWRADHEPPAEFGEKLGDYAGT